MTPGMQEVLARLDPQDREYFAERAGLLEFDCKLPREEAEALAFAQTTSAILARKSKVA